MTEYSSQLDGVLAEISAEAPTGHDVHKDYSRQEGRYTPITYIERYHGKLKSYLEQLEQSLQRGILRPDRTEGEEAGDQVIKLSIECLRSESKDLWVAAYLLHALCARSGFSGLKAGLHTLTQLLAQYGDQLHPRPINERTVNRLCQVADLLVRCVELSPLTDELQGSLCYRDKILADFLNGKPETDVEDYFTYGAVLPNQLEDALRETREEFLTSLSEDLEACLQEIDTYSNALASLVPAGCRLPNHTPLKKHLRTTLEFLAPFLPQPADAASSPSSGRAQEPAASASVRSAAVANRQEALERLGEIAQFFEENEPHSPISYAIRRAADWGNRPLSEVLSELLPEADMQQLKLRAGIPLPGEETGRPAPPARPQPSAGAESEEAEDSDWKFDPSQPWRQPED